MVGLTADGGMYVEGQLLTGDQMELTRLWFGGSEAGSTRVNKPQYGPTSVPAEQLGVRPLVHPGQPNLPPLTGRPGSDSARKRRYKANRM